MYKSSFSPTSLSGFVVVYFLNDCHSDWFAIESQCHFDPLWLKMLNISSYIYWQFVLHLLRTICSADFPFIGWIICCLIFWALYVFWILIPYQMNSGQRFFSHSVGCLFALVIVSFAVQKLFNLMPSYLSIIAIIISWAIGILFRMSLPIPMPCSVFPLFPLVISKFQVLH
jgi:hypothetical protein